MCVAFGSGYWLPLQGTVPYRTTVSVQWCDVFLFISACSYVTAGPEESTCLQRGNKYVLPSAV